MPIALSIKTVPLAISLQRQLKSLHDSCNGLWPICCLWTLVCLGRRIDWFRSYIRLYGNHEETPPYQRPLTRHEAEPRLVAAQVVVGNQSWELPVRQERAISLKDVAWSYPGKYLCSSYHWLLESLKERTDMVTKWKSRLGSTQWASSPLCQSFCVAEELLIVALRRRLLLHSFNPKRPEFFIANNLPKCIWLPSTTNRMCCPQISMSSLWQLTSGFDDPSTFASWWAILQEFKSDLTMPATVFTLCDVPNKQGYDSSALSTEKIASRFVQALALSFLDDVQMPPSFESAHRLVDAINEVREVKGKANAKDWVILATFANDLRTPWKSLSGQGLAMIVEFYRVAKKTGNKKISTWTRSLTAIQKSKNLSLRYSNLFYAL